MVKYCFSLVWMVRFRRRWLLRIVYCKGVYWALEIIECQVFIELPWISYVFHWTKHTQPLLKFSWPNLHAREDCLNISTADGCWLLLGRSVTGASGSHGPPTGYQAALTVIEFSPEQNQQSASPECWPIVPAFIFCWNIILVFALSLLMVMEWN